MEEHERQNIEATCARLLIAFGRHRDDRDADAVMEVIADDCVWERDGDALTGRERIRAAVAAMKPELVQRHLFTNILVEVIDNDRAEARAYYTVYGHNSTGYNGLPRPLDGPTRVGDYICRFVRTPAGWRLSYAVAKRVFSR